MSSTRRLVCLLIAVGLASMFPPAVTTDGQQRAAATADSPVKVSTLRQEGGRLDWSSKGVIAYDKKDRDGYFDIFLTRPGSGEDRCLTCDHKDLPNRQIGQPAWHPDGVYLAFQAQRGGFRGAPAVTDFFANPGAGIANDVWITNGERFWQLTNVPRGYGGVLHPQFAHDGRRLLWAERVAARGGKWGRWVLKIADFTIENGTPKISRTRTITPGRQQRFYESHGFSKDNRRVLFSGNADGQDETGLDIYWTDVESGNTTNLTSTPDVWDEHAHESPSGRSIVWMSSRDILKGRIDPVDMRGDYWMMDPDGRNQRRLTYFNQRGHEHHIPTGAVAADFAWSPDGRQIAAYVMTDTRKVTGPIMLLDFGQAQ
jgi:Tol biopolymer transport system component